MGGRAWELPGFESHEVPRRSAALFLLDSEGGGRHGKGLGNMSASQSTA